MSHLFALSCLPSPLLLLTLRATYCSFLFLLLHFFCFEAPQRAQSTQPVFHATKLSSELECEGTGASLLFPLFRRGRRHYCQLYCCEHLTAFRLLCFFFVHCLLHFSHSPNSGERPNDTTRPGAEATAPAPHAPPHATASNHLICPVLLSCMLTPCSYFAPFLDDLARRPPSLCREPPQMSFRRQRQSSKKQEQISPRLVKYAT